MSDLSLSQIEGDLEAAGWPSSDIPTAAAIAEAESSGNPAAIGPGGSWGLWQVQPQYHPDISQTTNPVQQASSALSIFRAAGSSFAPWSTYLEGTYQQYLGAATSALGTATSPVAGSAGTSSSTTSSATGNPVTDLGHGVAQALTNGGDDLRALVNNYLVALAVAGAVTAVVVLEVRSRD